MKNARLVMNLTAVCALLASVSFAAEEKAPAAEPAPASTTPTLDALTKEAANFLILGLATDVYSAYVWRGMTINDEPVWQPDLTLGLNFGDYGALTADVWANFDATSSTGKRHAAGLSEIDYTLAYSVTVSDFALSAGHIWYTFPQASGEDMEYGPSTREFFTSVSYVNDIVVPFVKAYYDYVQADSAYVSIGLNKEVALTDALKAGGEVSLGLAGKNFSEFYYGDVASKSGMNDANLSVYLAYSLTENISIGGKLAYTTLVDSELRDCDTYRSEIIWGGINLKVAL